MNQNEFNQLSKDLQSLVEIIPLNWGSIQNDIMDKQIKMFEIHSFSELEKELISLNENSKNYFRRRWFLWKNAQCDEHLFCRNTNVIPNPNCKDQNYDIEFNENQLLRFDIKGTVVPKNFRNRIPDLIENPTEMIHFFYDEQSRGVRSNIQNRLFIVHHSFRNQQREMNVRCNWDYKQEVYEQYSAKIGVNSNFISCKTVKADVIFIFENEDLSYTHKFFAV